MFGVFGMYISERRGLAGCHDGLVGVGRRLLSGEPWIAEPDRCTEPPFALGTGALEFCSFDQSGLGGR